jgi:hypothetical protein
MIEVYKTNVSDAETACIIINQIRAKIKGVKANFDLSDCDHVLRVEHIEFDVKLISQIVSEMGFSASPFE